MRGVPDSPELIREITSYLPTPSKQAAALVSQTWANSIAWSRHEIVYRVDQALALGCVATLRRGRFFSFVMVCWLEKPCPPLLTLFYFTFLLL